jgi:26S proteasome regulatory subunit N2
LTAPLLQSHALQKLHEIVDSFWAEIAEKIPLIEALSEDDMFASRELAASVASKVTASPHVGLLLFQHVDGLACAVQCFFHLEEYADALRLALGSGKYFDVSSNTEYVQTLVGTPPFRVFGKTNLMRWFSQMHRHVRRAESPADRRAGRAG